MNRRKNDDGKAYIRNRTKNSERRKNDQYPKMEKDLAMKTNLCLNDLHRPPLQIWNPDVPQHVRVAYTERGKSIYSSIKKIQSDYKKDV